MSAKTASLVAKILALVWIITASVLRGLDIFTGIDVNGIVIVGIVIAAVFATVDINIFVDKFLAGKIDPKAIIDAMSGKSSTGEDTPKGA